MSASFDIVVAAENNHYLSWQAMLFHYSCLTHMGCAPIFVVHGESPRLVDGYRKIQQYGGRVQRAPNFRRVAGLDYAPRNTAGTLLSVQSDAEYLVLCDPDMVFLDRLTIEQNCFGSNQITFDAVSYMRLDDESVPVAQACGRAGIALDTLRKRPISGGVPHIVPSAIREQVAREWLRCIDCFVPERNPTGGESDASLPWLATMWAIVFVVQQLALDPIITRFCVSKFDGKLQLGSLNPESPKMLHYCYGDADFEKREYSSHQHAMETVWKTRAAAGTINGLLCDQLRGAARYFNLTT